MSKEYKIVRLGDCATFINGKAFKPSDWVDDGVPIIRIQNLTGSSIEVNYFNGNIEDKYKITDGDILISWSASLGVFIWNRGNAVLNQHIFKVQFDKLNFDKSYFFYMIQDALDTMSTQVHGATMKHITKSNFDNISVLYPAIAKQQEIAAVLDKASELVEKRKVQLAELDALAESIFYDMFGDPVTNEKGWDMQILSDVCSKITDGTHKTPNYQSEGVIFVSAKNVKNGYLTLEDVKYISEEEFAMLDKRCNARFGDVVICKSGSIGYCTIIDTHINIALFESLALLKIKCNLMSNTYFKHLFNTASIQNRILRNVKGNSIKHLHLNELRQVRVILPPLQLQQQFAERIEKIEEQRQKVKAALKESEDLFQRLMQDMFNPEYHNS